MHTNFILGLLLSRLLLAYQNNRGYVNVPYTRYTLSILNILLRKGFIRSFYVLSSREFIVNLVYYEGRQLFSSFKVVSKPSKRIFMSHSSIRSRCLKRKLVIVSTNQGLLTSLECVALKLGGEILFELN